MATNKETKKKVAIKQMALSAQNMKMLITEIAIMKDSTHPAIVAYYESYVVEDKIWVVMELMSGGCLTDVLEQYDAVKLTEGQIAFSCLQVCFLFQTSLFPSYLMLLALGIGWLELHSQQTQNSPRYQE